MGNEIKYSDDGTMYIRKSMMEEFSWCPYRFKRVWIDHIEKKPNQAMLIGTRFHNFAERFFDYCLSFPLDTWPRMYPSWFTDLERDFAQWFIRYEMSRYRKLESLGELAEFLPVARETQMVSHIMYLTSTCDRVDWLDKEKDEIVIIEYKTGAKVNKESLVRQLAFYTFLWDETMNFGTVARLRLINPRAKVVKDYPIERWHVDKVVREIVKLREALSAESYPKKCSELKHAACKSCTVRECGVYPEFENPFD